MKKNYRILLFILTLIFSFSLDAPAQESPPAPTDETIRITTEEIHLNVTVQSRYGDSVPHISADDLLVVESGDPQKITSIRKIPANVLLLLDMGGNLNFAKTIDSTRLTAKLLTEKLSSENSIAVMQSYGKIEVVSDWTKNQDETQDDLDKKLFAGNRSRFTDSIKAAIEMFKSRPIENRHLVFIGDGLDSIAGETERRNILEKLLGANITVHVVGYNKMEAERAKIAAKPFQFGEKIETKRISDHNLEILIEGLPYQMQDNFRRVAKSERLFIVRLDKARLKLAAQKREDWLKSQIELQNLAEETGGIFQAPEEIETMWKLAVEIAKAIDSNYIITYTPTKPIADSPENNERKVRVSSYRNELMIRSRRKILISPND